MSSSEVSAIVSACAFLKIELSTEAILNDLRYFSSRSAC
jgi:hypothetical protein